MTPDNEDVFGFGSKNPVANNKAGPGALKLSNVFNIIQGLISHHHYILLLHTFISNLIIDRKSHLCSV